MTAAGATGQSAYQFAVTIGVVSRSTAGLLTVTFSVKDTDGDPVAGIGITAPTTGSDVHVYLSSIVPACIVTANTPTTTFATAFLEMWAEEKGDTAGTVLTEPTPGNYSFVMTLAAFAGMGGADALGATVAQTQRVFVRTDVRDTAGLNRTMGVADFTMPAAAGAHTGVIATTTRCREILTAPATRVRRFVTYVTARSVSIVA